MALTVTFHAGGLHTAKGSALDRGPVFQSAVLTLAVQMRWGGPGACSRSEVVSPPAVIPPSLLRVCACQASTGSSSRQLVGRGATLLPATRSSCRAENNYLSRVNKQSKTENPGC